MKISNSKIGKIGIGVLLLTVLGSVTALAYENGWCSTRPDVACHFVPPPGPTTPPEDRGSGSCQSTTYSGCSDCGNGYWYCTAPAPGDTSCSTTINVAGASTTSTYPCYDGCGTAGTPSAGPTGCL